VVDHRRRFWAEFREGQRHAAASCREAERVLKQDRWPRYESRADALASAVGPCKKGGRQGPDARREGRRPSTVRQITPAPRSSSTARSTCWSSARRTSSASSRD